MHTKLHDHIIIILYYTYKPNYSRPSYIVYYNTRYSQLNFLCLEQPSLLLLMIGTLVEIELNPKVNIKPNKKEHLH